LAALERDAAAVEERAGLVRIRGERLPVARQRAIEIAAILERIAPAREGRRETGTGGDRALVERDRLVDALRVLQLSAEVDERFGGPGVDCDGALEGARRAPLVALLAQHEAQVVPRRRVARLALDGVHEIRL